MVACEQTPLPSGKIGEGAPSPIFPERRGGLYTGYTVVMERGVPSTLTPPAFAPARVMDHAEISVLFCKDVETAPHYMVAEGAGESVDSRTKE